MGIRLQAPCSPAGHPLSLPPMLTRNVYRRLCTGSDASKYPNPLCTYMYVGTGGGGQSSMLNLYWILFTLHLI